MAELVAADDDRIDGRYLEVHQGLITLLATHYRCYGSATHLRPAPHHQERRTDGGSSPLRWPCKLIPIVGHEPPADETMVRRILSDGGAQARLQTIQAKQAFADRDETAAQDLVRQDYLIDQLNRECFAIALEIGDEHDPGANGR